MQAIMHMIMGACRCDELQPWQEWHQKVPSLMLRTFLSQGKTAEFFTSYDEVHDSFDDMDLHDSGGFALTLQYLFCFAILACYIGTSNYPCRSLILLLPTREVAPQGILVSRPCCSLVRSCISSMMGGASSSSPDLAVGVRRLLLSGEGA